MSDDSGFDEEEVKRAIALSMQDVEHEEPAPAQVAPALSSTGLGGLDRKAMERERLARLGRKRTGSASNISPPPMNRKKITASKAAKTSPKSPRQKAASGQTSTDVSSGDAAYQNLTLNEASLPFPKGVVKKTWCFKTPREGDDIKFEEVIQRRSLRMAVLSSFQWDWDWLLTKLDLPRTKLALVMQAKNESEKGVHQADFAGLSNVRLCFPPMPGNVHCMHSKLLLLSYDDYLRIAVPTANLTRHDWGESGMLENSVFIIDLPRRTNGPSSASEMGLFGRELVYFCRALGLQRDLVDSLALFDFSATEGLAFVHTIGGDHLDSKDDQPWKRTGHPGLSRAVQALGLQSNEAVKIDFVASSVGSLSDEFLASLFLACQGDDSLKELNWRTNLQNIIAHAERKAKGLEKGRTKAADPDLSGQKTIVDAVHSNFKIYFPSNDTVTSSVGGTNAGGVIFLNSKAYNSPKFPRQCMKDCKSTRPGVLMHNKILYVRSSSLQASERQKAWAYIGSSNCSESAWGKLAFNKTTRQIKLNCRNWECGVMIPVKHFQPSQQSESARNGMKIFEGVVPVPMHYPGADMQDRLPWHCAG